MKARFHPAYAITVASAFSLLISSAAVRSAPSMMIQPLEKEFGWSPATISIALALNLGLFGLVGPFAAAIFERFGLRRTIAGAFALLALAAGLSTSMTAPWQLILCWGLMTGLGTGCVGLVVGATIVNRWFDKRRGTVMGLLTASNATGQLVFLPLFGFLVSGPGWRAEALVVSGVCALLARRRSCRRFLRRRIRSAAPSVRWARACARATFGCSAERSSSAVRARTGSSARTSSRPAATTGSPKCAPRVCSR
jgi:MFS family permease